MKVMSFGLILFALAAFMFTGCDASSTPAGSDTTATNHDHEGHDHGDPSADDIEKIDAALAKLSPEDAAKAREQKVCPVTEEPLGSMGTPLKVEVEGQSVFICCEGCKDKIMDNPERYLSKIE